MLNQGKICQYFLLEQFLAFGLKRKSVAFVVFMGLRVNGHSRLHRVISRISYTYDLACLSLGGFFENCSKQVLC